eukprot:1159411-Pelagomonas_calceolata.AAC.7
MARKRNFWTNPILLNLPNVCSSGIEDTIAKQVGSLGQGMPASKTCWGYWAKHAGDAGQHMFMMLLAGSVKA